MTESGGVAQILDGERATLTPLRRRHFRLQQTAGSE